ncbi:MAG: hypothetical protein IH939_19775 [Acidobacteria bacterium]|nr:hypothetical protein [Acidobacteriota bacterium]
MVRPLDTSAAKTTCQRLTRLVAIAAIALGSPQTVTASSLFGNVTADLFAPAVKLPSVVDVDDVNAASRARVLESEDGPEAPEAMPTVAEEPLVLGSIQIPSVSQREPVQTSLRPPTGTSIDVSDLRNPTRRRPPALLPLYVTFAALQMLDAHSTTTALKNGAVEENPVVAALAGHTGVLYATKIAATAATVYIGEKLWRKNRFAAIMTMVAINSAYAVVVHRNYGIANR